MLKITRHGGLIDGALLKVEGTLGGAWVGEVRDACDALLREDGRVTLDLLGVVFVDRTGAALLKALLANPRVTIESTSPFVAELLKGGAA